MIYTINISPSDTQRVYLVNSESGYKIKSKLDISKNKEVIKKILGVCAELRIAQDTVIITHGNFIKNVGDQPKECREESIEFRHLQKSFARQESALQSLSEIKERYKIISITPY